MIPFKSSFIIDWVENYGDDSRTLLAEVFEPDDVLKYYTVSKGKKDIGKMNSSGSTSTMDTYFFCKYVCDH